MSNLKTRIKQKTDTSENWEKATNFTPLAGEYCFYSDFNKIKVGDGSTNINDLPFVNEEGTEIFTVTTSDATTVQDFRTLYETHLEKGYHYIYNFTAFDKTDTEDLRYCLVNFTDTSENKFFIVRDLATGKEYNDNFGYTYQTSYPLEDYFNGMCVGHPFRIIKITRTDMTFAYIALALSQMNELGINMMFDLSALLSKGYLCTIALDTLNKKATIHNVITNDKATISYTNTTLLTDIIPYIDTPIKVYDTLPTSGNYIGDMCIVKNYGWKDLSSDSELIVGNTYQLKIPANTACFNYSSTGNYVEVLNMTVKTSGKEAATYSYSSDYDNLIHTGSLCTKDKFYIITSVDTINRTFIGYDLTESTGDTEFLATGVFNSKNINVSGTMLTFLASKMDNYSTPKIWTGTIWSDIVSKNDINILQSTLLKVVDLSLYNAGDSLPDDLITTLQTYKSKVKYDNAELTFVRTSDETSYGYSEALSYQGIQFEKSNDNYHAYIRALAIGKSTKDSKWYLIGYYTPRIAAYAPDTNRLTIKGDSSNTFSVSSNDYSKIVNLKVNDSQLDSTVEINLPSNGGTLALVSDINSTNITSALGYTPISKEANNLTYYYTSTKIDELLATAGGGTSVTANPEIASSDADLSSIGIGTTNYNINAGKLDGHDVDDLTAIINAAYTPDVTVDSMNTAIETKINEALASLEFNRYYTGTTSPASDFGNDGDLYLQQ